MRSRITVLLADDHAMIAEGLASLLGEEFELVGTVADGAELVQAAKVLKPDVIIADIGMPVLSGLEALRQLREERVEARVVFLTMHADPHLASEALRAGAAGYLLKHAPAEELLGAVRAVSDGRTYLTPLITKDVLGALAKPSAGGAVKLTRRQREVLRLLSEGLTMKEVAAALDLSPRTVESHKYAMMETLGVRTTAELVRHAIRLGVAAT